MRDCVFLGHYHLFVMTAGVVQEFWWFIEFRWVNMTSTPWHHWSHLKVMGTPYRSLKANEYHALQAESPSVTIVELVEGHLQSQLPGPELGLALLKHCWYSIFNTKNGMSSMQAKGFTSWIFNRAFLIFNHQMVNPTFLGAFTFPFNQAMKAFKPAQMKSNIMRIGTS